VFGISRNNQLQEPSSRAVKKWFFVILRGTGLIVLSIFLFLAFQSRLKPNLEPWHSPLKGELQASDFKNDWTLDNYLEHENSLFKTLGEKIYNTLDKEDTKIPHRYVKGSPSDPGTLFDRNWNRTQILTPNGEIRSGAILLHGLTDSPYSMKTMAETLQARGCYALCLRMPGHGTVPGALTKTKWEDWYAAFKLGVQHVREKIGDDAELYFFGYSNGGAIALKYTFDSIENEQLPTPTKVFLLAPAVRVTALTHLSGYNKILSWMPYFKKFQWLDVYYEYDPFKYGSFCKNAARQSLRLSKQILRKGQKLRSKGLMGKLPPIITFQSVTDATVTADAVKELYLSMSSNGSELVLFDFNRFSPIQPFMNIEGEDLVESLKGMKSLPFHLRVISNENQTTRNIAIRERMPGDEDYQIIHLTDLEWPSNVYAFSHISLPFRENDLIYGRPKIAGNTDLFRIGAATPRGEKGLLNISMDHLMRLRYNPFFEILEERIVAHIE